MRNPANLTAVFIPSELRAAEDKTFGLKNKNA
jgi:hypothetical protein